MALVKHLLERKGKAVWSVNPNSTVAEAVRLMDKENIGALVVLEGENLVGIISERDLVRHMSQKGSVNLSDSVSSFMTTNVFFSEQSNSVDECMKLMSGKHIRHLPVMEKGKVVGVISINDLIKEIIADRETTIKSLENYITGKEIIG